MANHHSSRDKIRKVSINARRPTRVVGMHPAVFTDLYYYFLNSSWRLLFLGITGLYLLLNSAFASLYLLGGDCLANARPGSFADAFFFSVQTMATIGYGFVYPKCPYANILVTGESLLGLMGVAVVTGIAFNKFARPRARVQFSKNAVISRHDGRPTLMFRVANERANYLADATLTVTLLTPGTTAEGRTFTSMKDLDLARHRSPMFTLTWTALHPIDEDSPLHGVEEAAFHGSQAFIVCTLSGHDGITAQTVHSRHVYLAGDVKWRKQFVDILSQPNDGEGPLVDFRKFHDVEDEAALPAL